MTDCIYFVQSGEFVKVGYCAEGRAQDRLEELQVGNPTRLRLLGCIRGDRAEEARAHVSLTEWKVRGEWFYLTPTIREVIAGLVEKDAIDRQLEAFAAEWQRIANELKAVPESATSRAEIGLRFRRVATAMDNVILAMQETAFQLSR